MKKKGFTLIELLAVIVVLAIIAIIAVPQILGVIDKAREGAAEASVKNYIDAVEKDIALSIVKGIQVEDGTYQISSETYEISLLNIFEKVQAETTVIKPSTHTLSDFVHIKGTKPEKGYLVIAKNKVTGGKIFISGYELDYDATKKEPVEVIGKVGGEAKAKASVSSTSSTTNSIVIGYSIISGKEIRCEYKKHVDSAYISTNATVGENSCVITNLEQGVEYDYQITPVSNSNKDGDALTGSVSTISIDATPYIDAGDTSWSTSKTVTITVQGTQPAGTTIEYKVKAAGEENWPSEWTTYTAPFTQNTNATVRARLYDGTNTIAGEDREITKIDTTTPSITLGTVTSTTNSITIEYTLTAGASNASVSCTYGEGNSTTGGSSLNVSVTSSSCTLSNLSPGVTYSFALTPTSGALVEGTKQTGSQATTNPTASMITYTNNGQTTVESALNDLYTKF